MASGSVVIVNSKTGEVKKMPRKTFNIFYKRTTKAQGRRQARRG